MLTDLDDYIQCLRLAYGVWMLEHICENSPKDSDVFVMYDIACTFSQHLKARKIMLLCMHLKYLFIQSQNRTDILERVKLCLPAFHCYGHKVSCQVSLSQ